jgi:predicted DsbA family dithiol-disulfide isomerase
MRVDLDIWSDYVCPFCYLMVPALARLGDEFGEDLKVRWRAYELRPDPVPTLDPEGDYLGDVWSHSVYPLAAERGMVLQLPNVQPRSRLAHEASHFARVQGRFEAMNEGIFRAFFQRSEDIGKAGVLVEIGHGVGLDETSLSRVLHHRTQRDSVLADEEHAAELGLSAVPAMVIHRRGDPAQMALKLCGAQSYEHLHHLIARILHS